MYRFSEKEQRACEGLEIDEKTGGTSIIPQFIRLLTAELQSKGLYILPFQNLRSLVVQLLVQRHTNWHTIGSSWHVQHKISHTRLYLTHFVGGAPWVPSSFGPPPQYSKNTLSNSVQPISKKYVGASRVGLDPIQRPRGACALTIILRLPAYDLSVRPIIRAETQFGIHFTGGVVNSLPFQQSTRDDRNDVFYLKG